MIANNYNQGRRPSQEREPFRRGFELLQPTLPFPSRAHTNQNNLITHIPRVIEYRTNGTELEQNVLNMGHYLGYLFVACRKGQLNDGPTGATTHRKTVLEGWCAPWRNPACTSFPLLPNLLTCVYICYNCVWYFFD